MFLSAHYLESLMITIIKVALKCQGIPSLLKTNLFYLVLPLEEKQHNEFTVITNDNHALTSGQQVLLVYISSST